MAAFEYLITVVHHNERTWKRPVGAKGLLGVGVPVAVVTKYKRVRRAFTQKGLARKTLEQVN